MANKRMQTLLDAVTSHVIHDERLLQRFEAVPRECFVDEALSHKAQHHSPAYVQGKLFPSLIWWRG